MTLRDSRSNSKFKLDLHKRNNEAKIFVSYSLKYEFTMHLFLEKIHSLKKIKF